MSNDTLEIRLKLKWMMPPLGSAACERLIDRCAQLYFKGSKEKKLRPHRGPFFTDVWAKDYKFSKVVDRHEDLQSSRCPFIGDE